MSVSKQDQKLLLILLGVVIFVATYFGVYKPFTNKTSAEQAQLNTLQVQVEQLREFSNNQDDYMKKTELIDSEIGETLAGYPDDIRSEDMVMFVTKLESEIGAKIDSFSITEPELVSDFLLPKKTDDAYTFIPVASAHTGLTINCSLEYEQFKKLLDYIYTDQEKMDVSSVSISYDAGTGKLTGVISIDKYFIVSTDYSYTKTQIPSVDLGATDPFGSITDANTETDDGQAN